MNPDPRSTDIDPTVPLYPLRSTVVYPVPPVCTAYWTEEDWSKIARTVTEPEIIEALGKTWRAVGRNSAGVILYSAS